MVITGSKERKEIKICRDGNIKFHTEGEVSVFILPSHSIGRFRSPESIKWGENGMSSKLIKLVKNIVNQF